MKKTLSFLFFLLIGISLIHTVSAQNEYEDLLFEEVEVENPIYMPVVSAGVGIMNFFGEVQDDHSYLMGGQPGFKVNVSTYIDARNHYLKGNFFFIIGKLTGNHRSLSNMFDDNLNFETNIFNYGLNFEYGFGHLFKGVKKIRPFISVGFGLLEFSSKADTLFTNALGVEEPYNYYTDGTIRDQYGNLTSRDFEYESDLKSADRYNAGDYEQSVFSFPIDIGFDFSLSNRATFRFASSFHYPLTDFLDNISPQNQTGPTANSLNDYFTFTYATFSLDLFSEAKTIIQERYFAELEVDYDDLADEDGDFILDFSDECPGTPLGEPRDSVGCPFDDDKDGIPNYMDNEVNSAYGAIVDENGVTLSDTDIIASLGSMDAVDRKDAYIYPLNLGWSKYSGMSNLEIPERYKGIDSDNDEYISFDELLKAIDNFFDMESDFTTEDIYDLNDFFFAQ